ncbi:MAG: 4-hydroxybenzoate octaprenyltransferase [Sneathiella sp.]|jgi:4-hydroxybenzoate polyprenyltransferase|uniref:4-hydroxybenzoate octaprenyltransferase n=1 Tax=Sneathiella sp. TaxID=1964365 RepID=UPI000C5E03F3|nr:4-hydroxybenzoate octaprenyltransferase [Sneathiella sp.]MAL78639.1 4-hydroxybenzoate octaprenyltransferase [Sneathiella sp.]
MRRADRIIADASKQNWVDLYAPDGLQPYMKLSRLDRPIGTWLLLLPCLWSIALAAPAGEFPDLWLFILFGIGALVMRGAGCTLNDIADRNFDGQVERTKKRPIPSGQITLIQAFLWLGLQCLIGLMILLQFNLFAILLGTASLILVAIYPFAKRFTYWPQFFLGLAFNYGAMLGWAAVKGDLILVPVILYLGGIAWTLGYDTIYAHQDKEDDILIGVKSTALKLGEQTRPWLAGFYAVLFACLLLSGYLAGLTLPFYILMAGAGAHLFWQVKSLRIDDSDLCLLLFKSNKIFGLIVLAAIIAGKFALPF